MNADSTTEPVAFATMAQSPVSFQPGPPLPPAPAERRRQRPPTRVIVAMLIMSIAAVTLSVLAALDHLNAQVEYDTAVQARGSAALKLTAAHAELTEATETGSVALRAATDTIAVASDGFVGAAEKLALAEAGAALEAALLPAETHLDSPLDIRTLEDMPATLPRLREEIAQLRAEITSFEADAEDQLEIAGEIADAEETTEDAGDALLLTAAPLADALGAKYYSATNSAYIDFTNARDRLDRAVGSWGPAVAGDIEDYIAAAGALAASHAAEEAQKAGPLYAKRAAIEAFARSIAGGVRLDFDWANVVNGHGDNDNRYSGTATWNLDHGGYSTITLSNNIATYWNFDPHTTHALVAHEVGHAITSKCYTLFAKSFGSDDEVWATAWAIGMGHDNDGSGSGIYGRPSNELIELSKACR